MPNQASPSAKRLTQVLSSA